MFCVYFCVSLFYLFTFVLNVFTDQVRLVCFLNKSWKLETLHLIIRCLGMPRFLADRRAIGTVLRPSVVVVCRLYGIYCSETVRPRAKVTIESL